MNTVSLDGFSASLQEKVVLILRCADCGHELNRTLPITREEALTARVMSAFAAQRCPNGCRSTFSDLNINTRIEEFPACSPS